MGVARNRRGLGCPSGQAAHFGSSKLREVGISVAVSPRDAQQQDEVP